VKKALITTYQLYFTVLTVSSEIKPISEEFIISAGYFALSCLVLHRIAFPVVSEWCQASVDLASPVPL
jgi:hypothetical protein